MKYLKHKSIIAVFLFHMTCVNAQDYVARAKIHGVSDSGFYKILLSPGDKQFTRPDLGNLRIRDEHGREIPYIIEYGTKANELVAIEDFRHTIHLDTVLKKTVIDVAFEYAVQASQLSMEIKAPAFYKREATILFMEQGLPYKQNHDILIYSEEKSTYNLGLKSVKDLQIEIQNHDDIPLSIGSIRFFQKPVYMICSLLPGETYYLNSMHMNTPMPRYDLKYFRNKISSKLPVAVLEEMKTGKPAQTEIKNSNKRKDLPETRWFMWTCIGLGGIMTLFFAVRLLRDMRD
jgi:hypothetical protein